jgi:hypothetical protein
MRFAKTNDLFSDFVSIDPALGLEFGYTDSGFCASWKNFQKYRQLDNTWFPTQHRIIV